MNKTIVTIIIVFVCMGLHSCGAHKNISSSQEARSRILALQEDSTILRREIKRIMDDYASEAFALMKSRDIIFRKEKYSEPDSSGSQHVTERIQAEIKTEETGAYGSMSAKSGTVSERTDSLSGRMSATDETVSEESSMDASREPATGGGLTWILIACAATAAAIVIILKRSRR